MKWKFNLFCCYLKVIKIGWLSYIFWYDDVNIIWWMKEILNVNYFVKYMIYMKSFVIGINNVEIYYLYC